MNESVFNKIVDLIEFVIYTSNGEIIERVARLIEAMDEVERVDINYYFSTYTDMMEYIYEIECSA